MEPRNLDTCNPTLVFQKGISGFRRCRFSLVDDGGRWIDSSGRVLYRSVSTLLQTFCSGFLLRLFLGSVLFG